MTEEFAPHVQKLLDQLSEDQRKAQIAMIRFERGLRLLFGLAVAVGSVGVCIASVHPQFTQVREMIHALGNDVGGVLPAQLIFLGGSLAGLSAGIRAVVSSRL